MAVLGGSFDPIHHGHLIVAMMAGEALQADQVCLVPAATQPFKSGRHAAAAIDRAAMVELAVAGAPGLIADRLEVERGGDSYTVDTLRALRARHPNVELSLLIGSDAAALFEQWRDPAEIRRLADVVVFSRSRTAALRQPPGRTITVPEIDISSTMVRERVRRGLPIRYWVPDPVAQYIAAHGLYRD